MVQTDEINIPILLLYNCLIRDDVVYKAITHTPQHHVMESN
jgi:hypothetical protein